MIKFILNKLLLRSLVALVGPTLIYSMGFAFAKFIDPSSSVKYLNAYSITALVCISLIYPVNKIGLMITLKPIEKVFDWVMKIDNSQYFALRGNYKPVTKDLTHHITPKMILVGAIPNDINGVFLRNGPNPIFMPSHGRHHWFDGDGRIHGFRIKDGEAYYCTK